MHKTRAIGILIAMLLMKGLNVLTGIDIFQLLSAITFVIVVDGLVVKWISRQYLMMVAEEMQKPKEKEKNE